MIDHIAATPFGQLPALEYKGEVIGESTAIARFIAKEVGLAGKDNFTAAKADMIIDSLGSLLNSKIPYQSQNSFDTNTIIFSYVELIAIMISEKDEEKKKELKDKFVNEDVPALETKLEALLDKNGGQYMAGNEVTHRHKQYMSSYIKYTYTFCEFPVDLGRYCCG